MEVRVDLARIVIQEKMQQQIIYLRERDGEREFPIVIGYNEAVAIDHRLKGVKHGRPLTHDLMANIIERLDAECEKVLIDDLQDHTFYAKLILRVGGKIIEIDSRPSDAIALCVASDTPLFVKERVLREVCQ